MPTIKHRINLTIDDDVYQVLINISNNENKPLSRISYDLIKRAIELEEDKYFSRIADDRLCKKQKKISHLKAWKL